MDDECLIMYVQQYTENCTIRLSSAPAVSRSIYICCYNLPHNLLMSFVKCAYEFPLINLGKQTVGNFKTRLMT